MIVSWNVRGLNKVGKIREINSRLLGLQPNICVLLETRVKDSNTKQVREKLSMSNSYLDNYSAHPNGRIWILWDNTKVDLRMNNSSSQHIHCEVLSVDGKFLYWLTAVYAHNQLEKRKRLWKRLTDIHTAQTGSWCVIGDFNNVAAAQDKIGGRMVSENEYIDLTNMMKDTNLTEMDSVGDHFTWSNRQVAGTIYSRIDRVLCNVDWFLQYSNHILSVLPPNISDHALLHIHGPTDIRRTHHFKFNNYLLDLNGFHDMVLQS